MKFISFDYTDLKGKHTSRKALVVSSPSNKVSAIDVSEADDETIAMFASEYNELFTKYLADVEDLKTKYDLRHNYRQFFETSMNNVSTELL